MNGLLLWLTVVTLLGCGVMAGVFIGFSVLVMKALARRPAAESIPAMQAINSIAERPAFLSMFVGTTVACAVLAIWAPIRGGDFPPYLIAAAAAYIVGTFLLTITYHVPRNNALNAVDPSSAEASRTWSAYHPGWTAMNHVRAVAALAATAALAGALHVG